MNFCYLSHSFVASYYGTYCLTDHWGVYVEMCGHSLLQMHHFNITFQYWILILLNFDVAY